MVSVGPADRFDAFRALADRRGRPGDRLFESLAVATAATADSPEGCAPAVAAGVGLPAAAGLGPARCHADPAAPNGRRQLRGCAATACFAAEGGRHVTAVVRELDAAAGTASPDRERAVPRPCPDPDHPGGAALYAERPATPGGRAHLTAAACFPPGEQPGDGSRPVVLVTGGRRAHDDSGGTARRGGSLALDPVGFPGLRPDGVVRYGVRDGVQVVVQVIVQVIVESGHGPARLVARVGEQAAPGPDFSSFHCPASSVNRLASGPADTVTSCPEPKVAAVRVAVPWPRRVKVAHGYRNPRTDTR
ncbi:hypothetical protein ABZ611_07680 [Streptomyces sp. NPDC007861]|uniref:hypothetical protein n=1 Tax=Streptomyces sp. NPDC007861 TaxID=3154893 RepID=UPI0033F37A83